MSRLVLFTLLCLLPARLFAAPPEATTRQMVRPVLTRNEQNSLLWLTIQATEPFVELRSITVSLEGAEAMESLQVYLTDGAGSMLVEQPFGERLPAARRLVFRGHARLVAGANHLWLSCRLKSDADLSSRVDAKVSDLETSAGMVQPRDETPAVSQRVGVALRRHGDDGVHTYRIPALATTPHGTLLCVYDMRRRAGRDLQEDIDIGLLRSTDGGRTWASQQVIMDMGEYGGLPQEQNGCSDPGIVVDPETGEVFCFAVWTHGKPGTHQWTAGGSEPGHEIGKSSQFLMVRSQDDGRTWTSPENMTRAWKDPSWILYAPAPQQGIALPDGTLVMPTQGRDAEDRHFSNVLVSRDHGRTWRVGPPASYGNTECQAALLSDGALLLNCRSESPTKFRTVVVSRDGGQTWAPHPTNRNTLIEPNCNGSTYRCDYDDEGTRRSLLLFANPHSQQSRTQHSIQVSLDDGLTWTRRLLLDEGRGAGYPSLSRVDDQHLGIVYEGSGAQLVFERIAIKDLLGADAP